MMYARFQAVPLDGFHIILDLDHDRYLAVRRSAVADLPQMLDELAENLSVARSDIALWPDGHPRPCPAIRDLGPRLPASADIRPQFADWTALVPATCRALYDLRWAAPREWLQQEDEEIAETDRVVEAARRFRAMRPLIPGLTRCLPHALLLRAFLATLGMRATLVIAVRVFPFEAHSWVEADGVVLTDDLERLAGFTAIVAG